MTVVEDQALRVLVDERISELLKWRQWYRLHRWAEWTGFRHDNEVELRALVHLAREARRLAAAAPDPVDCYRAGLEQGRGYHEVQAR